MAVPEASIETTELARVCTGPGWFVVNLPEARWRRLEGLGIGCRPEGDGRDVAYARFGEAETVPYGGWLG